MTDVTYSQLISLINSSGLTEDAEYRITDYEFPTLNTPFSYVATPINYYIIVTAYNTSEIEDYVELVNSSDSTDTYAGLYDIDGTRHNYDWIASNTKGVIYYLNDSNGNEGYFDWKNIQSTSTNYAGDSVSLYINNSQNCSLPQNYFKDADKYYIPNIKINASIDVVCEDCSISGSNYSYCSYVEGNNIRIGMPNNSIYVADSTAITIGYNDRNISDDFLLTGSTGYGCFISGSSYAEVGNNNSYVKVVDAQYTNIGDNNFDIYLSGTSEYVVGDENSGIYAIGGVNNEVGNRNIFVTIEENTSNNTISDNNQNIDIASGCAFNTIEDTRFATLTSSATSCILSDVVGITANSACQNISVQGVSNITLDGSKINEGSILTPGDSNTNNIYNSTTNQQQILDENGNVTQDDTSPLYDAPSDGNQYARKDGEWVEVESFEDAPIDGNQYARKDGEWTVISANTEASANFRGNYNDWSSVPTANTGYKADYYGHTTPLVNDYMIVKNASDYTPPTAPTFSIETASRVCTITYTKDGTTTTYENVVSGNFGADNELNVYKSMGDWYFKANTTLIYNNTTYNAGDVMFYIALNATASKTVTVVTDALSGTWRFKYMGDWSTTGKSGWVNEYQIEPKPEAVASFRGSWANWTAVPTADTSYPADYYSNKTPKYNDYMVVQDASDWSSTGTNLYDGVSTDGSLNDNGTIWSTTAYKYSPNYISVAGGSVVTFTATANGSAGTTKKLQVYDSSKSVIANYTTSKNSGTYTIQQTLASNAAYVRICFGNTDTDMAVYGSAAISGSWRFNYQGVWATNGKAGWTKEYQVEGTGATTYSAGQNISITGTSNAINAVGYIYNTSLDSFREGTGNTATGQHSHAEGYSTKSSGQYSHTEGLDTTANTYYSHAEGGYTIANATASHSEGYMTSASGNYSHAEGGRTIAIGGYSHAEGIDTTANSSASHAEGTSTIANASDQHAQGRYNVADSTSAFIIGNGTSDSARSNAMTVGWDGTLTIGGVSITPTQLQQLLNLLS